MTTPRGAAAAAAGFDRPASPLRILLHDYSGHPFQVQLSRELARRGHIVLHAYCSSFTTGRGRLDVTSLDPPTFDVAPLGLGETFDKYSLRRRIRQEIRYGRLVAARARSFAPDVIVSGNTPLFAQTILVAHARRARIPFVFWVQDLYSIAMQKAGRSRLGALGGRLASAFTLLERAQLVESDQIVIITDDFRPVLRSWGIPRRKVHVIPNWAPLDELPPRDRDNSWAKSRGLDGGTVFLYAGTLGLKHDPELLVGLADGVRNDPDTRVVVISEGPVADQVRTSAQRRLLPNLQVLPFQPFEMLPEVLATADVLVAILERDAGVFSVPSKILSYLCAGRPILAALPAENLAAAIIREAGAGIVVEPGDVRSLVDGARALRANPVMRAQMAAFARAYAERTFDIGRIGDAFETLITRTAARGREEPDHGPRGRDSG